MKSIKITTICFLLFQTFLDALDLKNKLEIKDNKMENYNQLSLCNWKGYNSFGSIAYFSLFQQNTLNSIKLLESLNKIYLIDYYNIGESNEFDHSFNIVYNYNILAENKESIWNQSLILIKKVEEYWKKINYLPCVIINDYSDIAGAILAKLYSIPLVTLQPNFNIHNNHKSVINKIKERKILFSMFNKDKNCINPFYNKVIFFLLRTKCYENYEYDKYYEERKFGRIAYFTLYTSHLIPVQKVLSELNKMYGVDLYLNKDMISHPVKHFCNRVFYFHNTTFFTDLSSIPIINDEIENLWHNHSYLPSFIFNDGSVLYSPLLAKIYNIPFLTVFTSLHNLWIPKEKRIKYLIEPQITPSVVP